MSALLSSGRSRRGRGGFRGGFCGRGHSDGVGCGSRRRNGIHNGTGVLGTALGSFLAGALTVGIIRMSINALAVIGLTDIERDGLDVLRDVGGGAIGASAVEQQGALEGDQYVRVLFAR